MQHVIEGWFQKASRRHDLYSPPLPHQTVPHPSASGRSRRVDPTICLTLPCACIGTRLGTVCSLNPASFGGGNTAWLPTAS